jgi:hypothetical protein
MAERIQHASVCSLYVSCLRECACEWEECPSTGNLRNLWRQDAHAAPRVLAHHKAAGALVLLVHVQGDWGGWEERRRKRVRWLMKCTKTNPARRASPCVALNWQQGHCSSVWKMRSCFALAFCVISAPQPGCSHRSMWRPQWRSCMTILALGTHLRQFLQSSSSLLGVGTWLGEYHETGTVKLHSRGTFNNEDSQARLAHLHWHPSQAPAAHRLPHQLREQRPPSTSQRW